MLRTQSIKAFLNQNTHKDLANLYNHDMECQVNVAQDAGERVKGEYQGRQWVAWTDGIQTWKPFRIPYNANSTPSYTDKELRYSLAEHAEGIGMTGWDWASRLSRWVAFDFDAISGHKDLHSRKMTDHDLEIVQKSASDIPWVTVRRSAGGKGLHIYVFLNPVVTANHTEHSALARSILGRMSALTGFDFSSKVDICGSNMWIWHRKMSANRGLELLKPGEILEDIPITWKDHIKVITGHRKRILPQFIEEEAKKIPEAEQLFMELTGQVTHIPLDDQHKKLIKQLDQTTTWWDADHWMLVTHTFYLKQAHTELGLRGIFETLAEGTEAPTDHNCFMFPMRNGAWSVRRYGLGIQEHPSWSQDGQGWTRCYYNMQPDLNTASRAKGGLEDPSGGFTFRDGDTAEEVASVVGAKIDVPLPVRQRPTTLKEHKSGRLLVEISSEIYDTPQIMAGWLQKGKKWTKLVSQQLPKAQELEVGNYDDFIRHMVSPSGEDYGWVLRSEESWHDEPLVHVKLNMKSLNVNPKELDVILGNCVNRCWTMVNRPFQSEYPGGRAWNRDAAQYAFLPSQKDNLSYPNWSKILEHCGKALDEVLKNDGWAKANGIISGGDYLKIWISSLLKEPERPLPYLFFYGNEESGKSIFHEAISLLITKGYRKADAALISQAGFNAELRAAIVCVVEEVNLQKNTQARNRIKEYVTAIELSVHEKGQTPVHVQNTTHWIQCANESSACPVFPGDSRITVLHVEDIDKLELIPKGLLMEDLKKEGPDFLASVLKLEIPPPTGRLNIPVILTSEKVELETQNQTPVDAFLREKCYHVTGEMVKVSELYDNFVAWADSSDQLITKIKFSSLLPAHFPKARSRTNGQWYIGNISFAPFAGGTPKPKLIVRMTDKNYPVLEPENDNKRNS